MTQRPFPNVSELQVASTWPSESLRVATPSFDAGQLLRHGRPQKIISVPAAHGVGLARRVAVPGLHGKDRREEGSKQERWRERALGEGGPAMSGGVTSVSLV